jgi:hypothetical protein
VENNAARFFTYVAESFLRATSKRPDYFRSMFDVLEGSANRANDLALAWEKYRSILIRRFEDQPVFGDDPEHGTSVAQVYQPLRCWWDEVDHRNTGEISVDGDVDMDRKVKTIHVDMLEETLLSWLSGFDPSDRIRLISGGPGSGKSTFAKRLAAVVAPQPKWNVIFIPLQRLHGMGPLEERINSYFSYEYEEPFDHKTQALNGLVPGGHKDWLFIFDGLDELAKEGDGSESAAQDFATSLADFQARLGLSIHARFLVLGRAPSMQEARRRLGLMLERTLNVTDMLPFKPELQTSSLRDCKVVGNAAVLSVDQRPEFWARWAVAKGKNITPPAAITAQELTDLTKEPLLAHLLIISGYVEERWEEAANNRNRIYEAIFRKIWIRESTKETRQSLNDLGETTFYSLLQCLGIAAWRGGGRTGDEETFKEIRDILLPVHALKKIEKEKSANLANVALLFYTRKDEDRGGGYEFIHKSFGEYLTACGLFDAFLRWGKQASDEDSDFAEVNFLERWLALTGATAISQEVHSFLRNEVRLKSLGQTVEAELLARAWLEMSKGPLSSSLMYGFPIPKGSKSWRELEREQLNAELALWAMLDSIGRVAFPIEQAGESGGWLPGPISIPGLSDDPYSLARLLHRHDLIGDAGGFYVHPDSFFAAGEVNPMGKMISRIDYRGAVLSISRLSGCDLRGSNLTEARFLGTNVFISHFGHAKLDRAVFVGSQIAHCSFKSASMEKTDFRETKLNTVEVTQSQIEASRFRSKRAIKNVIKSTDQSGLMINIDQFFER